MLGVYQHFPEIVHRTGILNYECGKKTIQQLVLFTFHNLNNKIYDLADITDYSIKKCKVGFEFGVAEGINFNFLDQKELEKCLESIEEKNFPILDFFFVVHFHVIREGNKRIPLKFDYHVLRLTFKEGDLEIQIRHEKGTRRIPLDDLISFIIKQINLELSKYKLF